MNRSCSKCGAQIESPWGFCPHCGAANALVTGKTITPEEHEKAPVQGAFGGLLFGVLAAPVLIIVGGMLCLTGLGIFAGIPMIIAGVFAPLLGPMLGLDTHKGKCPWCGAAVSAMPAIDAFDCPSCSGKIAVKNHRNLVKAV
jgi:DNA-directed RNA polymerase subunit RPC12/RpoP